MGNIDFDFTPLVYLGILIGMALAGTLIVLVGLVFLVRWLCF